MNATPKLHDLPLTALPGTTTFKRTVSFLFLSLSAGAAEPIAYSMLPGSTFVDDCLLCDRPTIIYPMQGSFELLQTGENPLVTRYQIQNLEFSAGREFGRLFTGTGGGTYSIGGEVAVVQTALLTLDIADGYQTTHAVLTNDTPGLTAQWPNLQLSLSQTNGTFLHLYRVNIIAERMVSVPVRIVPSPDKSSMTLAWPVQSGIGSILMASQVGNFADWREASAKVTVVGEEYRASIPTTNTMAFFQLHLATQ
jgi:hypothetical protein